MWREDKVRCYDLVHRSREDLSLNPDLPVAEPLAVHPPRRPHIGVLQLLLQAVPGRGLNLTLTPHSSQSRHRCSTGPPPLGSQGVMRPASLPLRKQREETVA